MAPKTRTTLLTNWKGAEVARRLRSAAVKGIDDTMAASVIDGKGSHPGWKNQTGNAEGSIRIISPAKPDSRGVVGRWGSTGIIYFEMLELKKGSALRMSAQANYPSLQRRIAFYLGGVV